MISKSQVRQPALAAIYAVMENGGEPDSVDWELFWTIAEERKSEQLCLAVAKAIEHHCRANSDLSRLLSQRADDVLLSMEGDLTTAPLRAKLERYVCCNRQFDAALGTLHYSLKNKKRITTEQIHRDSEDVLKLAAVLIATDGELTPGFADFPAYHSVLEPLAAAVHRRTKLMEGCVLLRKPTDLADDEEFRGLAELAQDKETLRTAAQELATSVLKHKEMLDARLSALVQNYSVERMNMMDRCILYLALYECEITKLDTAVAIAEAARLANEYSGSKSVPFIHGIIAAAAKA